MSTSASSILQERIEDLVQVNEQLEEFKKKAIIDIKKLKSELVKALDELDECALNNNKDSIVTSKKIFNRIDKLEFNIDKIKEQLDLLVYEKQNNKYEIRNLSQLSGVNVSPSKIDLEEEKNYNKISPIPLLPVNVNTKKPSPVYSPSPIQLSNPSAPIQQLPQVQSSQVQPQQSSQVLPQQSSQVLPQQSSQVQPTQPLPSTQVNNVNDSKSPVSDADLEELNDEIEELDDTQVEDSLDKKPVSEVADEAQLKKWAEKKNKNKRRKFNKNKFKNPNNPNRPPA